MFLDALMQIQYNPNRTGHIQICKQDTVGSQWLALLKILFDLVDDKCGLSSRMNLPAQMSAET